MIIFFPGALPLLVGVCKGEGEGGTRRGKEEGGEREREGRGTRREEEMKRTLDHIFSRSTFF
jgi:hypothetical protein